MLKFKTSCAVLAYLSSNLLNEVGLFLFRYFEVGLRVCDIVVKKLTFAISSPDEFLFYAKNQANGVIPNGALSVRRSSKKTSTRRRSRIPCVVVEKIMTRRREGLGVVVEKIQKVDELSTKILPIYLQQ